MYRKIFSIMWTKVSISGLSPHESPSLDDCDMPELQCVCHELAVRDINYTEITIV
jgi:hypothetical protein